MSSSSTSCLSASSLLESRFQRAKSYVSSPEAAQRDGIEPTQDEKLRFYGLYKQSQEGDVKTERPSFWDAVARAKWDAYAKNCGLSAQEAKVKYIDLLVHVLRRGASLSSSTSSSVNILIDDLVGGTTSSKDKFNPSSTDSTQEEDHFSSPSSSLPPSPVRSSSGAVVAQSSSYLPCAEDSPQVSRKLVANLIEKMRVIETDVMILKERLDINNETANATVLSSSATSHNLSSSSSPSMSRRSSGLKFVAFILKFINRSIKQSIFLSLAMLLFLRLSGVPIATDSFIGTHFKYLLK